MKQAAEIYEQMLQVFRDRTGLSVGDSADLSVRLYAAAAELETLYGYCRWSLAQSFPQTAVGEYLERHAALRGLSRKKAAAARGQVTFYVGEALAQDVPIPAETEITDAGGVSFFTEEAGVIPAGSLSAAVPAVCGVAGEGGNAAAGTVCRLPLPPAFVLWCGNETAFSGGCEEESDEELRQRVLSSFSKLPNGANAAYYESRARAQEGVAGVRVLPRNRGVGTVDVVISSQEGVPPQTLL